MTKTLKKEYQPGGSKRQHILDKAVDYIATGPGLQADKHHFCLNNLKLKSENLDDPSFNMLEHLGFSQNEIEIANTYCCGSMTLEKAPHIKDEHLF